MTLDRTPGSALRDGARGPRGPRRAPGALSRWRPGGQPM